MEQRIFDLGLSVEAVSLYILLDHFENLGRRITRNLLLTKWSSSADRLETSLQELEMQGVITEDEEGIASSPVARWQRVSKVC